MAKFFFFYLSFFFFLKLQKHEVNDVTSDVGKEELVTMKYIEELNKFYKKVGLTNKYDDLK
jgi:hypothetical protein